MSTPNTGLNGNIKQPTADGVSVLAACTTDVKQWYKQNGLQLNPDKVRGTSYGNSQSAAGGLISDVSICRWSRPPHSDSIKVFGVTLDRRLTLDNHVSAVARSCNYHA